LLQPKTTTPHKVNRELKFLSQLHKLKMSLDMH
jgi:hypothetical protein